MRYDQPSLPNPHVDELSLDGVARFIASEECKSIAVLSGAGISAANDIPTYRGKGGLYQTLDSSKLAASAADRAAMDGRPEVVFSAELFERNPLPLLEMKRRFCLERQAGEYKSTLFHLLIDLIEARTGKLVAWFDQNIDAVMGQCSHVPPSKMRTPHGRVDRAACHACGFECSFDAFCEHLRSKARAPPNRRPRH